MIQPQLAIPGWMRVISTIRKDNPKSLTELTKAVDMTYQHMCRLSHELKVRGIITKEEDGRIVTINLTPKGNKVCDACDEVFKYIKNEEVGGN